MYVCMCVCVCVCVYVCMYVCMYVCVYVHTHVCIYACMHACMHACMYVCMYVYIRVYTHSECARTLTFQNFCLCQHRGGARLLLTHCPPPPAPLSGATYKAEILKSAPPWIVYMVNMLGH